MRQAGFTDPEFSKLSEAKANSDLLTATEFEAMRLAETTGADADANHAKARLMLYDASYHQAKAAIMKPIYEVGVLVEKRTGTAVEFAQKIAFFLRIIFILFSLCLLLMLYQTHQFLRSTLGGTVDEIYAYISRIGKGNFASASLTNAKLEDSVLGCLVRTRQNLHQLDQERKQAERQSLESGQRFHQMFAQHSSPMLLIEPESGAIVDANQAASQFYGYTIEQLNDMNIAVINANSPAQVTDELTLAAREQRNYFVFPHRLADGSLRTVEVHSSPMSLDGRIILFSIIHDITDRKKAEDDIKLLAFYDPLTNLANRRLLTDRMEQTLLFASRTGELVVVCMLDLDGFKLVNDQLGHEAGDQLLIEVARRLQECVRQSDTASRFGGDEFALILGGFKNLAEIEQLLNRVITSLAMPYALGGEVARISASVGATIFPNDSSSAELLLRHADQSMYEAKQAGKNCYRLFNPTHHNQQQANQATFQKIEAALMGGQLAIFYQPQVDCRHGKVVGAEALIRWNHPILGLLSPSEFIPLIEHHELIVAVGEWAIQAALQQLVAWRAVGIDLSISVNISAYHLHKSNFVARLKVLLADYDAKIINHLAIEILETAALENVSMVVEAIQQCRVLGIHVSLDDFGTGFSSLAHLKQLPVDTLKIDQSFVMGMLHNSEDLAIVSGVIGLATSFGRKVVAEGVESLDHILMLMEMGCFVMQGYSLARPMTAERMTLWVKAFKPDPLWKLSHAQRPSRDYFELLLAESNHRHGLEQLIAQYSVPNVPASPESLLDYQHCHFGQWYYGKGLKLFGMESYFSSIEPLHRQIHQTAANVCAHKRLGNKAEAQMEAENLLRQQDELDQMLNRLRVEMAHQYLTTHKPKGEIDDRT